MQFAHPNWLFLLWLLPALLGVWFYADRKSARVARRFAEEVQLHRLAPTVNPVQRWLRRTVIIAAIGLLMIGTARPRWGQYFEEVQLRGIEVFVLLDVSRSMLADDVKPNRLERAKSDIRDLLDELPGDRLGLIVFAGSAEVEVPLTSDHGFFRSRLGQVDSSSARRGGSMIGDALRKATSSFGQRADYDRAIVMITDGEDHDSYPDEAAQEAAEAGIKVFAIGLGDPIEGNRIPLTDEAGNLTYLRNDGQEVWSRLDEAWLKRIALQTGGAYVPARTQAYDLGQIYRDHLATLARAELETRRQQRYYERFQLFLAVGLVLIVLEAATVGSGTPSQRAGERVS
jgi:Ca-activated chloride channel family protein